MANVVTPFTQAQLYFANGDITKEWYIFYHFAIPGQPHKKKRFKERFDINRIHDGAERLNYGRQAVQFMNERLKNGFNPFTAIKVTGNETKLRILPQLEILKAELSSTAPSDYAVSAYTEQFNRLLKYIQHLQIEWINIAAFDMEYAKQYKKWLLSLGLSQKTINSSFSYLSKFWELGIEKKYTDHNPFVSLPRVKKREIKRSDQVERFEPFTSEEMDKIFTALYKANQQSFIAYLGFIFYAWARPVEISRLRISDLELSRSLIRFRKAETKNNNADYVQIVDPLMNLINKINIENYPDHYYIFSDDFKPGERQISKHYALKRWRKLVKSQKNGLNINKDMYALKHTGNIEYLLNNKGNADLKWQQMQNRHSSSVMTDRYNRKLGAYFIEVGGLNFRSFDK